MPEIHAAADIFCLPTLYEGLPLAVLEAMACGKAVVATRTDGIPEAIRHGQTGLLVPVGRTAPLAKALDLLLRDESLRKRLGREARKVAIEGFTWDRVMSGYGEIFRQIDSGAGRAKL